MKIKLELKSQKIVGIILGNNSAIKFLKYFFRDIGVMNEKGTVSIVGRSKDMIVRGGENVYPIEIEQFLDRHPDVDDVQVNIFF